MLIQANPAEGTQATSRLALKLLPGEVVETEPQELINCSIGVLNDGSTIRIDMPATTYNWTNHLAERGQLAIASGRDIDSITSTVILHQGRRQFLQDQSVLRTQISTKSFDGNSIDLIDVLGQQNLGHLLDVADVRDAS
jgi:hypothetical protein